jgi:hypothetical protein
MTFKTYFWHSEPILIQKFVAAYKITEFFKGEIILKLYITKKQKYYGENIYRFCNMFGGWHVIQTYM